MAGLFIVPCRERAIHHDVFCLPVGCGALSRVIELLQPDLTIWTAVVVMNVLMTFPTHLVDAELTLGSRPRHLQWKQQPQL